MQRRKKWEATKEAFMLIILLVLNPERIQDTKPIYRNRFQAQKRHLPLQESALYSVDPKILILMRLQVQLILN